MTLANGFQCWTGQSIDGVDLIKEKKICGNGVKKCKNSSLCELFGLFVWPPYFLNCPILFSTKLFVHLWNSNPGLLNMLMVQRKWFINDVKWGQWLWISWQTCLIWCQKSGIQIQSQTKCFLLCPILFLAKLFVHHWNSNPGLLRWKCLSSGPLERLGFRF